MRKRIATAALSALGAMLLLAAPSASAAVEFGDNCVADDVAPDTYTLTTLAAPPGPIPLTAPSAGVVTKIRSNVPAVLPFATPISVKILRNAGGNLYTAVNQATVNAAPGISTSNVRLPALAGDRLGLHGLPFSFEGTPIEGFSWYCDEMPGSTLGAALGDVPTGATAVFEGATDGRVPLVATLEPDADNDGFGDESQDLCPQGAAVQTACPAVTIDAYSLVGGNAVKVLVATSTQAPVKVTGTVKLGKGSKATLKGGTKGVPAGKLVRFTLKFPGSLKEKLRELESNQKLTLKITASATNVAGQVSTDKLKAKLKGLG